MHIDAVLKLVLINTNLYYLDYYVMTPHVILTVPCISSYEANLATKFRRYLQSPPKDLITRTPV